MSPLRRNREDILHAIERTQKRMGELYDDFVRSRGICCVQCASQEYRDLRARNERRRAWLNVIDQKLARDAQP